MLANIGLIGLAVMGENLVMNMESKGFTVAVFNRTVEKVTKFVDSLRQKYTTTLNLTGETECHSQESELPQE